MKKWCLFLYTYACVCLLAACAAIGGGSPSSEEAPPEEPQESTVVCRVISVLDGGTLILAERDSAARPVHRDCGG